MLYKMQDNNEIILEISNKLNALENKSFIKLKFNNEIDSSKNGYYSKSTDEDNNIIFLKDTGSIFFSKIIQLLKENKILEIEIEEKIIAIESNNKLTPIIEILLKHEDELIIKENLKNNRNFITFYQTVAEKYLNKKEIEILKNETKRCPCCGIYTSIFLQDYRGSQSLSKYTSCPICYYFEDDTYFFTLRTRNKYEAAKFAISIENKKFLNS